MFSTHKSAPSAWAARWWTSSDGLALHARDYAPASGEAKLPVICLHGLTRNARDFEDVAPLIAGWGRRVLAPDVRGRGASARDPSPMNYHPGIYAADIVRLMEALGIARAQFVGTSMGGLITMTLAALRPELVAGAVLNDIGPELSPEGIARIAAYVGQPSAVKTWKQAAAFARGIGGDAHPAFGTKDWDTAARRWFREGPKGRPELDYDPAIAIPIKAAADAPPVDLWPYYQGLTTNRELLIIRGEISDLFSRETLKRMIDLEPTAEVVEVAGVGHAPTLEEPAAVNGLKAFFEKAL